jgi:hypothetical protein
LAKRTGALALWLVLRGTRAWIVRLAAGLFGILALAAILVPLLQRGGNDTETAFRVTIADGAIVAMATLLASSVDVSINIRRVTRLAGVPVSVIVVIAGVARFESSPTLARAMRAGGGLAATVLSTLGQWPGEGNDGSGSRFQPLHVRPGRFP